TSRLSALSQWVFPPAARRARRPVPQHASPYPSRYTVPMRSYDRKIIPQAKVANGSDPKTLSTCYNWLRWSFMEQLHFGGHFASTYEKSLQISNCTRLRSVAAVAPYGRGSSSSMRHLAQSGPAKMEK